MESRKATFVESTHVTAIYVHVSGRDSVYVCTVAQADADRIFFVVTRRKHAILSNERL